MIRFGVFEVDLQAGELRKAGRRVKVQEKPFQILSILLERPGEVVTRDQLRQLWPEDTFLNSDQGLNTAMVKLRSALGDSADNPRFIETLPRRGYRFLPPVELEETASVPTGRRETRYYRILVALASAFAGMLVVVVLNWGAFKQRLPGGGGSPQIDSLAVLPFSNLMGDPEQDYVVDGMTDLLIADLAQISSLRVTSRTSSMQYKNTRKSLPQIAQELGVAAVVEGSVLRSGDRLRINLQLIEAATDRHFWAGTYEGEFSDVLALQGEVARAISREVQVVLTPQERERLSNPRPVKPEAYQAYLMGRYFWNKRTEAGLMRALAYFEKAIDEDPTYALAYVGLADSYSLLRHESIPAGEPTKKAKAAILKALALDDNTSEAHASLGLIKAFSDYDWAGAEQSFKRAVALSPSYATAHHWYGLYMALMGRADESLAEMKRALELDPLSLIINVELGSTYHLAGQFDRALDQYRKALELDSNFAAAHFSLGMAYIEEELFPEAIAECQMALDLFGTEPLTMACLGHAHAEAGNQDDAQKWLRELTELSSQGRKLSVEIAIVYIGLGETDRALTWLEKAYEDHHFFMPRLRSGHMFDNLRSDARFQNLIRRLHFPQ